MLSLQSFLREGRVVGLCWANPNLKDLKHSQRDGAPGCEPASKGEALPPFELEPQTRIPSSASLLEITLPHY